MCVHVHTCCTSIMENMPNNHFLQSDFLGQADGTAYYALGRYNETNASFDGTAAVCDMDVFERAAVASLREHSNKVLSARWHCPYRADVWSLGVCLLAMCAPREIDPHCEARAPRRRATQCALPGNPTRGPGDGHMS